MFARFLASKTALSVAAAAAGVVLLGGVAFGALGVPNSAAPLGAMPQASGSTLAERGRPDRLAEILDKLVKDGVITAEQRDKILKALAAARGQDRNDHPRLHAILGNLVEESAKIIGVTPEQLKQELPGKSVAQVAAAHGVPRGQLIVGLNRAVDAAIDKALAEGKITEEQAKQLKAHANEFVVKFVDRVWPQHRGGDRRSEPRAFLGNALQNAASAIGISVDDLKKELPGKSLAQVAQTHGVSRDALVAKLTASATNQIDKALADRKLTADQAAAMKARLADAIGKLVDQIHKAR